MRSKNAIKNIATSLCLQLITVICGLIVPKLIISTYGSSVNGLIKSITEILGYILVLDGGFDPVIKSILYKAIAKNDKQEIQAILKSSKKIFTKIAYAFILYVIILIIIYPYCINNQFDRLFTTSLIVIISISTLTEYFFGITYYMLLQAVQKTYVSTFLQIISKILNTIIIVILIHFKCSIITVNLISSLIFVIKPIIQNIYVRKVYNINLKEAQENYKIKSAKDGISQNIAYITHSSTDLSMLTIFTNLLEVSVYSVHMLVIKFVRKIMDAFTRGIEAIFGDIIAKNEKENLKAKFELFEFVFFIVLNILFSFTIQLIMPFIKVYTKGITDVNYIRPTLAVILIIAEFIFSIRQPYKSLVLAAGKFKETKKYAWIEALVNIILSGILVIKYGTIGVAIGTLAAVIIRTIELTYFASKYILERSITLAIKKVIESIIQNGVIFLIFSYFIKLETNTYLDLFKNATLVGLVSFAIIVPTNVILYNKDTKKVLKILSSIKEH